jgi:hypothetical protein
VAWDPALLEILPASVAGLPLNPEPDAFATSASDPNLVRDASSGVVAIVADGATSDYAVTFVYELRPGVYDDAWARAWRDSFDSVVCDQAGGVTGHAQAVIGGHPTDIGSCAGGILTYQVHLTSDGTDRIVAIQSNGDQRFGEQVVAGLRA